MAGCRSRSPAQVRIRMGRPHLGRVEALSSPVGGSTPFMGRTPSCGWSGARRVFACRLICREASMSSERLHLLVADDERLARRLVRQYAAACSGIEVVHECGDTASLSAALREQPVDAALLDIRMPGRNVFDVLTEVASVQALPLIVFATAYDRYALRAFEVNAVDYLLKPFTESRFRAAMDRLQDRRRSGTPPHGVPTLLRDLGPRPDRLLVP